MVEKKLSVCCEHVVESLQETSEETLRFVDVHFVSKIGKLSVYLKGLIRCYLFVCCGLKNYTHGMVRRKKLKSIKKNIKYHEDRHINKTLNNEVILQITP